MPSRTFLAYQREIAVLMITALDQASDIDRAVPQAFPDLDVNVHGFTKNLRGRVGIVTLSASDFPHVHSLAPELKGRGPRGDLQIVQPANVSDGLLKSYARGYHSDDTAIMVILA